jgi:hypothetical protein
MAHAFSLIQFRGLSSTDFTGSGEIDFGRAEAQDSLNEEFGSSFESGGCGGAVGAPPTADRGPGTVDCVAYAAPDF